MSSPSSAFQSSLVLDRKFMYVLKGGDEGPALRLGGGDEVSAVRSLVEDEEGGVFGRDDELDRFLAAARARKNNDHKGIVQQGNLQRVELEHVGMRICGADHETRVILGGRLSLRRPPEGRRRAVHL